MLDGFIKDSKTQVLMVFGFNWGCSVVRSPYFGSIIFLTENITAVLVMYIK